MAPALSYSRISKMKWSGILKKTKVLCAAIHKIGLNLIKLKYTYALVESVKT